MFFCVLKCRAPSLLPSFSLPNPVNTRSTPIPPFERQTHPNPTPTPLPPPQFKFYPQIIIVMKYAQGGPGQPGVPPIIEMTAEMCEMRGPIVEQYNDRMGFDLKVLLGTKGQKMTCEATIKVLADPPAPLDVVPK